MTNEKQQSDRPEYNPIKNYIRGKWPKYTN